MKQWFLIENKKEYNIAAKGFEEIYEAGKDAPHFKEMLLLALLIN